MEPPQIGVEVLGGDAAPPAEKALDLVVAAVDRPASPPPPSTIRSTSLSVAASDRYRLGSSSPPGAWAPWLRLAPGTWRVGPSRDREATSEVPLVRFASGTGMKGNCFRGAFFRRRTEVVSAFTSTSVVCMCEGSLPTADATVPARAAPVLPILFCRALAKKICPIRRRSAGNAVGQGIHGREHSLIVRLPS